MAKAATYACIGLLTASCQRPPDPVSTPVTSAPVEQSSAGRVQQEDARASAHTRRQTVDLDREVLLRRLRERSGTIASELATTRSLARDGEFEVQLIDRPGMRAFVQEALYEDTTPEEIRLVGRIQGALGVLPIGVDAESALLDMYENGLVGLYDPDEKTLLIGDYVPDPMLEEVLGHEIAHAVQDMHFDLSDFQTSTDGRSDEDLAKTFLMEGDAHAAYLMWSSQLAPERFSDRQLDMMADQALEFAAKMPHSVLARQLQMPYTEATNVMLRFVRARGWSHVDKLYARPPASTEQMMHVEKLLADERPRKVRVRVERLAAQWPDHEEVWQDNLGESALLAMLADVTGAAQARLGSRGWDGDRFVALQRDPKADELPIVAGAIAWDTSTDAQEFEPLFREYLRAHVPGRYRVQRKGDVVAFVAGEATPEPESEVVPRSVWRAFVLTDASKGRAR